MGCGVQGYSGPSGSLLAKKPQAWRASAALRTLAERLTFTAAKTCPVDKRAKDHFLMLGILTAIYAIKAK